MGCDHFLGQIVFIAWIYYLCLSIHHLVILLFVYLYNIAVNIHTGFDWHKFNFVEDIYYVYYIYYIYIIYMLHIYYIYYIYMYNWNAVFISLFLNIVSVSQGQMPHQISSPHPGISLMICLCSSPSTYQIPPSALAFCEVTLEAHLLLLIMVHSKVLYIAQVEWMPVIPENSEMISWRKSRTGVRLNVSQR